MTDFCKCFMNNENLYLLCAYLFLSNILSNLKRVLLKFFYIYILIMYILLCQVHLAFLVAFASFTFLLRCVVQTGL